MPSSNSIVAITIRTYCEMIVSAGSKEERFNIIVELFDYLHENYHFLETFPRFKDIVRNRLEYFIGEDIPEFMKEKLRHFMGLLFPKSPSIVGDQVRSMMSQEVSQS